MRNFTEEYIYELADSVEGLEIKELWYSTDTLSRNDFRWLNIIAVKEDEGQVHNKKIWERECTYT